jgi:hypothetical protein
MMNRRLAIILAILVIVVGLTAYSFHFSSRSISGDTRDWSYFSTYINPFVTLANLTIFIWFSNLVFTYNSKKDSQEALFKKVIERPVLIFTNAGVENEIWVVKNIGKGAALNLKIFESSGRSDKWKIPVTKCYSLGSGETLKLDWLSYANIIGVLYEDVFSTKYIAIGADDETHIKELDNYETIAIRGRNFPKSEFVELETVQTQRMALARKNIGKISSTTDQTTSQEG